MALNQAMCLPKRAYVWRTFSTTVNERLQTLRVLRVDEVHKRGVHPSPRLNRIETADDEVELHVEVVVFVLDLSVESNVA